MSTIKLNDRSFDVCETFRNNKKHLLPEFVSKGTQSYKDGVWGYYRSFRFGFVLGYFDGTKMSFTIKSMSGQKTAQLNMVGDKVSFWGKPNIFRRGGTAIHYFKEAVTKLCPPNDFGRGHLHQEVLSYMSFFCAHMLPAWNQPKEGIYQNADNSCYNTTTFSSTWNKVLFPLLDFVGASDSRSVAYKMFRGEASYKSASKKLFGAAGKTYLAALSEMTALPGWQNRINSIAALIKAGASNETSIKATNNNGYLKPDHVAQLLEIVNVEKLVNWLQSSQDHWLLNDTMEMLTRFPSLEIGKEIKGIKHLHDVLGYMRNNVQETDADLWCHPDFYIYEGQKLQDYTIRFPQKLSDLKYWGSHLSICVGGYGERVHTGKSIVFALYKDDKPCVCVEIKGENHRLSQVYGKYNEPQPEELSASIKDLVLRSNKPKLVDDNRKMNFEYKELDCKTLYKEAVYHVAHNQRRANPFIPALEPVAMPARGQIVMPAPMEVFAPF